MQTRNARWANAEQTAIDCEIEHPEYGWVPFTATPNDPEDSGRAIFAQLQSDGPAAYQPPPIEASKTRAVAQVDADVDAIYAAVVGNRGLEYEAAEREAAAYAAAGYTGTAGPMVQSWADVKGWPADEAADDILQQATAWRAAMAAIRAQRLATKEALRSAATAAAVQTAAAQWSAFVAATRAALGL